MSILIKTPEKPTPKIPVCHPDRKYVAKNLCGSCYVTLMHKKHPKSHKKAVEKYRKSFNGRVRNNFNAMRCNKKRNIPVEITLEQYIEIVSKPCAYSKKEDYTIHIGIDRKDNNKGYTIENSIPCCYKHNIIKSNIFSYEEMLDLVSRYPNASKCGDRNFRKQ